MRLARLILLLTFAPLLAAAGPKIQVVDHAGAFERVAMESQGLPYAQRAAAVRKAFDRIMPGLYTEQDAPRIVEALKDFPNIRPVYLSVERRFSKKLATSVERLRGHFPGFAPAVPIYLVHSLGQRDGGTHHVAGRKVMIFGADLIAQNYYGQPLQSFFDHELFHLEHDRHFTHCDQLWCSLWQEGLATYAASLMTPGASDEQLLLDVPIPIRPATDARWDDAVCWASWRFASTRADDIDVAFTAGQEQAGLPSRFGYYVGMRIAVEAAKRRSLPELTRLDSKAARAIVAEALGSLIAQADAPCEAPGPSRPIVLTALGLDD